jgi:hypothetical protein
MWQAQSVSMPAVRAALDIDVDMDVDMDVDVDVEGGQGRGDRVHVRWRDIGRSGDQLEPDPGRTTASGAGMDSTRTLAKERSMGTPRRPWNLLQAPSASMQSQHTAYKTQPVHATGRVDPPPPSYEQRCVRHS